MDKKTLVATKPAIKAIFQRTPSVAYVGKNTIYWIGQGARALDHNVVIETNHQIDAAEIVQVHEKDLIDLLVVSGFAPLRVVTQEDPSDPAVAPALYLDAGIKKIDCIPTEDLFPPLVPMEGRGDARAVLEGFNAVKHAAAPSDCNKRILAHVQITKKHAVATDGHRLALHEIGFFGEEFYIPAYLDRILSLPGTVDIHQGHGRTALINLTHGVTVHLASPEGVYPDWQRIMDQRGTYRTRVTLDKAAVAALKEAVDMAARLKTKNGADYTAVKMDINGSMKLTVTGLEWETAAEYVTPKEGEDIKVALCAKYLGGALGFGPEKINLIDPQAPIYFEAPGHIEVVMPMMIKF